NQHRQPVEQPLVERTHGQCAVGTAAGEWAVGSRRSGERTIDRGSMSERLTHLDAEGQASMVDVGEKAITSRTATARGEVRMKRATPGAVRWGSAPKGDVLATARLAGIMAAKRTAELIPLCHTLLLTKVSVDFELDSELEGDEGRVVITATVKCN